MVLGQQDDRTAALADRPRGKLERRALPAMANEAHVGVVIPHLVDAVERRIVRHDGLERRCPFLRIEGFETSSQVPGATNPDDRNGKRRAATVAVSTRQSHRIPASRAAEYDRDPITGRRQG